MNIDWGQVAVIVVVLKGLWDIWKERRKPSLDLSALDSNIAQAANVSVKSLLEIIAQMQKRVEQLESSEKSTRHDLQRMGQVISEMRTERSTLRLLFSRAMIAARGLLTQIDGQQPINTTAHQAILDKLDDEFHALPPEP